MKRLIFLFLSLSGFTIHAQTVDEIINKNIEASGGKAVISGIRSVIMEGEMDIMGNMATSITYMQDQKGYKSELDINGTKIITVYTNEGGWTINPMSGATSATPIPESQFKTGKLNMDISGPLFNYKQKGYIPTLEGKEELDGKPVYKIKITNKDSVLMYFYIDNETYRVSKTVSVISQDGNELEVAVKYDDYRKTDAGWFAPYKQEITLPGLTLISTNTKIETNKEIDPAIFKAPEN